ncbi:MAG: hypothetical protein QG656_2228, partial [Candidatus Hydrogenedentes bacterium]|nr:hypothetical protein [Candidatus Hydrogenedentota bacterium]
RGGSVPCGCSRRTFLASAGAAVLSHALLNPAFAQDGGAAEKTLTPMGPGSKYTPRMKAAFVRRKGEYGLRWPGQIYDGEAARQNYTAQIAETARGLGMDVEIRPEPIYSIEEGAQWIAEVEAAKADGLLLVVLDRQEHAWPTATLAVDSPVPAVIFSPIGTSFTTNTAPLADKTGAVIFSTDDFGQVAMGMKMVKAGAKLREARIVVIKGTERKDDEMLYFGTKLRYVPAKTFLDVYQQLAVTPEIEALAQQYIAQAQSVAGPSPQDVINGVKSFAVARQLLEQEEGDAITMDCLGALGKTDVSLPCIAWSHMLDRGIPAACEADLGACLTHALVQYLFDRPGFQQDPVADTAHDTLIGAHCTCPTRLNGFNEPPEPYRLSYHHGKRDAVPVPHWREGQRVTIADILPSNDPAVPPQMIVSTGTVAENISVPPAGGCVVSVGVKVDNPDNLLAYPGFHQVFFYGDFKKELRDYCRLYGIPVQLA